MESLDSLPINVIDIGVILIILISAVLAYARGFIHEVLSVAGWLGAFFATVHFYPFAEPYALKMIPVELAAKLTAGAVIFIVTLVILSLLTNAISSRIKDSSLNVLDRSLGFLFGVARGALVVCVLYIGLAFLIPQEEQPEWITAARTVPLMMRGADMVKRLLPENTGIDMELPDFTQTGTAIDLLKLVSPKPEAGIDLEPGGYNKGERQDMERLITSQ